MSAFGGKADIFNGKADITSATKSNSGAPSGRERLSTSSDNRVYRMCQLAGLKRQGLKAAAENKHAIAR